MSIPSWARVGASVECIADAAFIASNKAMKSWAKFPSSGGIYIVRGVVISTNGIANLLLVGINNAPRDSTVGVVEWGFQSRYFRPVDTPLPVSEDA